jgi:replicative DNA helicase
MKGQEFELENFAKFGKNFQEKLVQCMFYDRSFYDQMSDIFDIYFLELKYLRLFYSRLAGYRSTYEKHPSVDIMTSVIKTELDDETEVVKKQVRDYFARIAVTNVVEDSEYVKATALDFCKKQKLKEAIMKSVGLLKTSSFDEIKEVIDSAMKLGLDNNHGYDYLLDFEERFMMKSRNPMTTGWKTIDDITKGGLGRGELGVVIAPTGAGKSMALVHLGAQAVKAGKNVVYYTLELLDTVVASRFDSCITGIRLQDLTTLKDEVYDEVKDLEGRLIIKEYPTKSANVNKLKQHLEKLRFTGFEPDLICVDYGDLLSPISSYKEKRIELETIYEDLRGMAQEFECPVWTASQTNRSGLNAEVVTMESISEAFNKCFVADFIFTLSRTITDKNNNSGRIFVAKNRNGPDGIVYPIFMDTSNIKIDVLSPTGETADEINQNAAKKQQETLREKYKRFRNGGN